MSEQEFLPEHFLNRELSWLEFNRGVWSRIARRSAAGCVKFLLIFSSDLY